MTTYDSGSRVPTYIDFMNPVLRCLRSTGESATNAELLQAVIEDMKLPSEITDIPHGDGPQREVDYRLAWAKTYLKKDGLIDNSQRGVWSLTQDGRDADEIDGQELAKRVRQMSLRGEEEDQEEPTSLTVALEDEPDDSIWQEELLRVLVAMAPDAFERFCGRLLRESGFDVVKVTGRSGDGGIDGQGVIQLGGGMIGFPVYFQCKRYSQNVSASAVRDFRGAMQGRGDRGLIIATANFTSEARREATRDGALQLTS